MNIDFVRDVGALTTKEKNKFYFLFSNRLTTSIREIFADEKLSDIDKIEHVKLINEVIHRTLNRLFDLEFGSCSWSEADIWGMIKNIVRLKVEIKDHVSNAISGALSTLNETRESS